MRVVENFTLLCLVYSSLVLLFNSLASFFHTSTRKMFFRPFFHFFNLDLTFSLLPPSHSFLQRFSFLNIFFFWLLYQLSIFHCVFWSAQSCCTLWKLGFRSSSFHHPIPHYSAAFHWNLILVQKLGCGFEKWFWCPRSRAMAGSGPYV